MFDKEEFKKEAGKIVDWIADYLSDVEKFPVASVMAPGEVKGKFPQNPPKAPESLNKMFDDFKRDLLPGITHWQSPSFHAYFPANSSTPSLLAEFLTAALGIQGMKWVTSPAATELEMVVMEWLRQMLDLPEGFSGVIQDTASVSTLCAILAARERASKNSVNQKGMEAARYRVYCSSEAHASIEKAVRIAGLGSDNLVKIPVDEHLKMNTDALEDCIKSDRDAGFIPTCIVAAVGSTGTCAVDPLESISRIAVEYNVWLHVDAAFAGTAMILPEFRRTIGSLKDIDSFVFNPHKWMFTNFDCSAFFVKDKSQLQDTFRLVPSYLQTDKDGEVEDFSNYSIQLGRRFRALKLWYVIRYYGVDGVQQMLREHLRLAAWFEQRVNESVQFETIVPRSLVVVCFRMLTNNQRNTDEINKELMHRLNNSGEIYLSHTLVNGKFALRMVTAQTHVEQRHVEKAWQLIEQTANEILTEKK